MFVFYWSGILLCLSVPHSTIQWVPSQTRHDTDRRLRSRCCHLGSYLQPSRSWLQEVVPSVRCLQRVFLRCVWGCVWASLPQPGGDFEQPQLMYKYDDIHKTEIRNISLRRKRKTEPRPEVTCIKIWRRSDVWFWRYDRGVITHTAHLFRHQRTSSRATAPFVWFWSRDVETYLLTYRFFLFI